MIRVDHWTDRQDKYLAKTVLEYVREGKTQLEAFEEVGRKIKRSPAACGYRWNKALRQSYEKKLKKARMEWWEQKKMMLKVENVAEVKVEPLETKVDSEWLTTGELIDRLKIGEIAQVQERITMEYVTKTDSAYFWCDEHGRVGDAGDIFYMNDVISKMKWRIVPKQPIFVGFTEAMIALNEGKKVWVYDGDKKDWFSGILDYYSREVSPSFHEMFSCKWSIEG